MVEWVVREKKEQAAVTYHHWDVSTRIEWQRWRSLNSAHKGEAWNDLTLTQTYWLFAYRPICMQSMLFICPWFCNMASEIIPKSVRLRMAEAA